MGRTLGVLWAFLVRDATMAVSYRLEFALHLATVVFYVSALYFLSDIVGDHATMAPYGGYLPFAALGVAVASFFQTGFDSFARSLHREQLHGTLEALLLAPLRLSTIAVSSYAWRFSWSTLISLTYVVAAVVLYDTHLQGNPFLALGLLLLTTLAFASLGLISASFVMVYKRGDPVGMLLYILPITHGLEAIRAVLLQGEGLSHVWPQLLVLSGFAGIGIPLGMLCFRRAVRRARREGSLLHF